MELRKRINWFLLVLPLLIFSFGYITLFSTYPELSNDQLLFFCFGYLIFLLFSFFDYKILGHFWKIFYFSVLVMLLIVDILGQEVLGSARWLTLGGLSIQPSEFAKFVSILTVSYLISISHTGLKSWKVILRCLLLIAPIFVLVFLQPDLGTSLIIIALTLGIFWFAGLNKTIFVILLLLLGVFSAPVWNILKDYQKERILVFLNPTLDTLGSGYNVIQSTIAVGSGQLFGKGFGRGTQSHLQFLPVYWTDFIFAAYAEEWGFIGILGLLFFYTTLLAVLLYVALNVFDTFGSMFCVGVFIVFFAQFTINIGMNLGLMPVTGIPLPLISYGGSSVLTSMILLGIVHSVWIYRKV